MYKSWTEGTRYLCSHFRVNAAMYPLPMTLAVRLGEAVPLFCLFISVSQLISVIILCPMFRLLLMSRLSPTQKLTFLIFELWTFPLAYFKKGGEGYFVAVARPHPTKWHDYFSSWGSWLPHLIPAQSPAGHQQNHLEGTVNPNTRHTTEVTAQTQSPSQSSASERHRVGREIARTFQGHLMNLAKLCSPCSQQHCSGHFFRAEGWRGNRDLLWKRMICE